MAKPARDPKQRMALLQGAIAKQVENGADPGFAFLHVPKTGGSGLNDLFAGMRRARIRRPMYLSHHFDLAAFAKLMPESRLILVLRDPLERIASGFASRQRMGRPRYNAPWTPGEAVAFMAYRSPEALFRACLSDDDHDLSMSTFALAHIRHIRRGYVHYFGGAEAVAAAPARFALVGDMGDMAGFVNRLADLMGAKREKLAALYKPSHVSARGGAAIMGALDPEEIAALRARFDGEYRVWSALRALNAAG